jgi:hypothetical protein
LGECSRKVLRDLEVGESGGGSGGMFKKKALKSNLLDFGCFLLRVMILW